MMPYASPICSCSATASRRRRRDRFAAGDHADAYLQLAYIHGANLLVYEFVFNGAPGVGVQLAFGDIRRRAMIAGRIWRLRRFLSGHRQYCRKCAYAQSDHHQGNVPYSHGGSLISVVNAGTGDAGPEISVGHFTSPVNGLERFFALRCGL